MFSDPASPSRAVCVVTFNVSFACIHRRLIALLSMMQLSLSFIRPARTLFVPTGLLLHGANYLCSQINVEGSGTQEPAASDLVSIPGVYDNVKFPDIWDNFVSFTLPAPPVAQLGNNGGSTPPPAPASAASSSATHAPSGSSSVQSSAIPTPPVVPTSAPISAPRPSASSSLVSAPAPGATGRCKSRRMVKRLKGEHAAKRHVSHAKRHHH